MPVERQKDNSCCFTGHRQLSDKDLLRLNRCLDEAVEEAFSQGVRWFLAGGAKGFDTLAALAVLRLRQREPQVGLRLILPCKDQAKAWSQRDRQLYQEILEQADEIETIFDVRIPGCMQARNRQLVDESSRCLAYMTQPRGGTWYTYSYALERGIPVENLAEDVELFTR